MPSFTLEQLVGPLEGDLRIWRRVGPQARASLLVVLPGQSVAKLKEM
ncbi:hypothetical protein SFHH103_03012 [Sinorhizobium fredii HH103]|uniref:Uncharacterized protein n=1 Tax=Sinorhizobium fredii (strain HH103) TaxID=1117943 RepID=G9A1C4_SINF1|nr:hypothetical protein SF83666_c31810 [Sinorhizobium fredii CCBAU 83666]AWI58957.1 hypothetical protein AB395_00003315 [Sinorhizobium fredii CCBAU 45436]AWM26665.1 hypothetical protein AOX55_00003427 [Sinorhizobium fredii CCBAU 25509]CCE97504.1 hypothetical protein SFHH103_03012 [Sinorhizobium fredii HH103]